MSLTPEQECDMVRYLAPLARKIAHRLSQRTGKYADDLMTSALMGVLEAARTYDGNLHTSLWNWANWKAPRFVIDEERIEVGRPGTKRYDFRDIPVGIFRGRESDSDDNGSYLNGEMPEHMLPHAIERGYDEVDARLTTPVVLASVSPMHRKILTDYYLDETPILVLMEQYGVSDSQFSQLKAEALRAARRFAA